MQHVVVILQIGQPTNQLARVIRSICGAAGIRKEFFSHIRSVGRGHNLCSVPCRSWPLVGYTGQTPDGRMDTVVLWIRWMMVMESPRPEKALNRPMSHYYVSYYFIRQPQTKAKSRPESRFIATNNPIHRLLLLLLLLLLVESGYLVANYYTTTIIIISPRSPSSRRRPLRICVYAHALIETVGMQVYTQPRNPTNDLVGIPLHEESRLIRS